MATKEIKKISDMLVKIGVLINENPFFINQLEEFLNSSTTLKKINDIDYEKINRIDLFQMIREKTEFQVNNELSTFSISELREILKKYRFGSPSKLKTSTQLRNHILNQLNQRKTDVFQGA